jgi:ABC-type dipeptide/oligopeptide/nickel transport system permease subunit
MVFSYSDINPASSSSTNDESTSVASDMKLIKSSLATGLHLIVAVVASFVIGYFAGKQTDGKDRTVRRFSIIIAIPTRYYVFCIQSYNTHC